MAAPTDAAGDGAVLAPARAAERDDPALPTVRVWDVFVRVFHWSLVILFVAAFVTGDGSERLHIAVGYAIAVLVALRIVWGFVGTRHARFASFVHGPRAVKRYLLSLVSLHPERHVGHNPAGGWAVLALLGLGAVTALTGWLNFNDYGGHWLEELHEGAASAMLALVFVHIGAVVVSSLIHRENLVRAMLSGFKRRAPE